MIFPIIYNFWLVRFDVRIHHPQLLLHTSIHQVVFGILTMNCGEEFVQALRGAVAEHGVVLSIHHGSEEGICFTSLSFVLASRYIPNLSETPS